MAGRGGEGEEGGRTAHQMRHMGKEREQKHKGDTQKVSEGCSKNQRELLRREDGGRGGQGGFRVSWDAAGERFTFQPLRNLRLWMINEKTEHKIKTFQQRGEGGETKRHKNVQNTGMIKKSNNNNRWVSRRRRLLLHGHHRQDSSRHDDDMKTT